MLEVVEGEGGGLGIELNGFQSILAKNISFSQDEWHKLNFSILTSQNGSVNVSIDGVDVVKYNGFLIYLFPFYYFKIN